MLGLFLGAAILGIIIIAMEEGDFPGWVPMIGCVLAAGIPTAIVSAVMPLELFFVGPIVGGIVGAFAVSAFCGMSVKRACIAMAIYIVIQIILGVALGAMMG